MKERSMRKYFTFGLLSLIFGWGQLLAQTTPLYLYGEVEFPTYAHPSLGGDTVGISDCWGWVSPEGVEYGIVGILNGTAFVRISDMEVVAEVAGPTGGGDPYYHRDIKTWRNYAVVVAEMTGVNDGVQVIDMSYLPDSVHLVSTYSVGFKRTSHNLSIDTITGFAYLEDAFDGGVRMIDLSDPANLSDSSFLSVPGVHDIYARNDTLWVAEGGQRAFSVYDVSDKTAPVLITRITDPSFGYCHNIWPTDDGQYFVTTEETDFKTVKIWDMSDPANVTLEGEYLADCNLAHNAHVMGDSVYLSHYESGMTVVDISDKTNPVEVRHFDTYPASDLPEFRGSWGAYPFTPSGLMYISSFEGSFHVVSFDSLTVGIEDGPEITSGGLFPAVPNPFSTHTTIPFEVLQAGHVTLKVVSLLGKEVTTLVDEFKSPGQYESTWEAVNLPTGIYIAKMELNGSSTAIRIAVQ